MKKRDYHLRDKSEVEKELTELQKKVTQEGVTEMPFKNTYFDNEEDGIYVDLYTGEPLFSSTDKYDAGCGWPSFTKPIEKKSLKEKADFTFGMHRVEVKSKTSDSHLGHVFDDGPKDKGGLRYCMNSAAMQFIPKEKMKEEGYEEYLYLFEK
jgi:methionine-R-sulfoxide reductase